MSWSQIFLVWETGCNGHYFFSADFKKTLLLPYFQNKIILDPMTFSEARFRPSLEERLESIISGAALMADSSCTRDDRRERIVAECNAVRQALQDLLSEYMNNVSPEPSVLMSRWTPVRRLVVWLSERMHSVKGGQVSAVQNQVKPKNGFGQSDFDFGCILVWKQFVEGEDFFKNLAFYSSDFLVCLVAGLWFR